MLKSPFWLFGFGLFGFLDVIMSTSSSFKLSGTQGQGRTQNEWDLISWCLQGQSKVTYVHTQLAELVVLGFNKFPRNN